MQALRDLDIQAQVIPLFDFTNSEISRRHLANLFLEVPSTLEIVYLRQDILKGFISNWTLLGAFVYQPIDFREAYQYSADLRSQPQLAAKGFWRNQWNAFRVRNEIPQKRSRLVQLAVLFDQLYTRFFQRLDYDAFPASFQTVLKRLAIFVEKAQLSAVCHSIRQNTFGKKQVLRFEAVLHELSQKELPEAWEALAHFESYFSLAKGILKMEFVFPTFTSGTMEIAGMHHPLLKNPVKNSVHLKSQENVVLLTGPNMSGKSTLLKSLGICVYLAHLGLAVPATACTLPYFSTMSVSITSRDDLTSGYSHFMQELMTLKTVVEHAKDGKASFAVFDELFKGTNADDAQEILLQTLTGLQAFKGSYFFISTHLLDLKTHPEVQLPSIKKYHLTCDLQEQTPIFTYHLEEGWSTLKIGKILFEQVGLQNLLKNDDQDHAKRELSLVESVPF